MTAVPHAKRQKCSESVSSPAHFEHAAFADVSAALLNMRGVRQTVLRYLSDADQAASVLALQSIGVVVAAAELNEDPESPRTSFVAELHTALEDDPNWQYRELPVYIVHDTTDNDIDAHDVYVEVTATGAV